MVPLEKHALDSFGDACGAPTPLSFLLEGTRARRIEVPQPFAVVGRSALSDVCLPDPHVSRRHAYVQMIDGAPFLIDLESRGGTQLENADRPLGWLNDRDVFRIGSHRLQLEMPEGITAAKDFDPLAAKSTDLFFPPYLALEIITNDGESLRWQVNRRITLIGTSRQCSLRLHGTGVARCHCALVCTRKGTWIVDLVRQGKLLVNGERVSFARLNAGGEVKIGEFTLQVHSLAERGTQLTRVQSRGTLVPQSAGNDNSIVIPLVNQLNLMHNQMFEQFQQTVMMMFQMFGNMHKEQLALIRQELDEVQELTRELQLVQHEMSKVLLNPAGAKLMSVEKNGSATPETALPASVIPRANDEKPAAPAEKPVPEKTLPRTPAPSLANGPAPGQDLHAWLCERMAAIQQKRQNCVQRILGFLAGKG